MEPQQGKIEDVVGILNEDKEKDFANALAITARQRKGKSRLAHYITTHTYQNFSYEKNYLGNPKHGASFKTIRKSEKRSTNWIDEAEKILSTENRMSKDQWWLQQLFNQDAENNRISIFCTPDFLRIDNRWRRTHISIWIYLIKRGLGVILKNRDLQSSMDTWGLKAMGEYEVPMKASDLSAEKRLQAFGKNPAFLFYFTFPDWDTPEQKSEYEKYKHISQDDLDNEFEAYERKKLADGDAWQRKAQIGLGRLASNLNIMHEISYREIGQVAGYSDEAIKEMALNFESSIADNPVAQKDLPHMTFNEEYFSRLHKKIELNRKL